MNENIDLTKILDGCPKGTKLYSPLFGEVEFKVIPTISKLKPQIIVDTIDNWGARGQVAFTPKGRYFTGYNAECLLFPSSTLRDWSKFERFWDKSKVERFDPNTLQPFDRVIDRRDTDCYWVPRLFGYMDNSNPRGIDGCIYSFAIPYNDETKHLVGTTDDCPEYYKWWKE